MIINFADIKTEVLPNFKGGEKEALMRTYEDENNRILMGKLAPGASIGLHTHEGTSETIFIQSGSGTVLCDGNYEDVKAGDVHYCPQGHEHSLINNSAADLTYFAVVPRHCK